MKVLILTEGGKNIGFGHLTRCVGLYQAFEEKGIMPEFIVNGDKSISSLLKDKNYQIVNWFKEKYKLFEIMVDADIVIVDSYLTDISFYKSCSKLVKVPVYLDDNNRLTYPRGIVVNGNIYAEYLDYYKNGGVLYLLGTKYTPLRKEFWNVMEKKIKKKVESVMITVGGVDTKDIVPKILKFLSEYHPILKKNVIIGKAFRNINEIKREADKNKNVELIWSPDAEKMKQVMVESDVAISAGGQTLYELARVGVPTVGICVAENQSRSLITWHEVGFVEYVGLYSDFLSELKILLKKIEDREKRDKKFKIAKRCVDGRGALRIIDCILENLK